MIGVVVPCLDEEASLRSCLLSVRRQQPPPDRIVVVDNGSADDSVRVAQAVADLVLEMPRATIGGLRNAGAAAVPGCTVVAFLDADCEAGEGWLAAALAALEGAELAGARTEAPADARWVARRWAVVERRLAGTEAYIGSANMAVRADAFRRIGGFDEALRTAEDVDLCARVRGVGGRTAVAPEMRVVHHGAPRTLAAFARRQRWHASTAGWWWRTSWRGRALIALTLLWSVLGAVAAGRSVRGRDVQPSGVWGAVSVIGVSALGALVGSSRHALADGALVTLWSVARASRLPRGLVVRQDQTLRMVGDDSVHSHLL